MCGSVEEGAGWGGGAGEGEVSFDVLSLSYFSGLRLRQCLKHSALSGGRPVPGLMERLRGV